MPVLAPDVSLKPTPGQINYLKLHLLIVKGGTRVLRKLLEFVISPEELSKVLTKPHVLRRLKKLEKKHVLSENEWQSLDLPLGSCQPESFDIALLLKLLRQDVICHLIPPTTGWNNLPNNADLCLEADIARILYYRNLSSHINEKMEIREPEFRDYWKQVKDAILRIVEYFSPHGSPLVEEWEKDIDELLTHPLDADGDQKKSSFYNHVKQVFSLRCVIKLASVGAWLGGTLYVLNMLKNNADVLANLVECVFPDGISVFRIGFGSIKLQLCARDLLAMEELRKRYESGQLKKDLEKFMVTEELKHLANEPVEFDVEMDEEEYLVARQYLYDNQETTESTLCETEREEEKDETTSEQETTTNSLTFRPVEFDVEMDEEEYLVTRQYLDDYQETTKSTLCETEREEVKNETTSKQETTTNSLTFRPVEFDVEMDEEEYLVARQYLDDYQETTESTLCETKREEEKDETTSEQETTTNSLTFGEPGGRIPIQHLKDNNSALEKLSQCLDRVFPHIKYWLHFAEEMKIDSKVICQCRLYSENSPTVKLFEFLKATTPQLSVKELGSALIEIKRTDIHSMIITCKGKDQVSEVITDSSSDIMDTIALELDSASKPIGNWEKLAQQLEVPRDIYQKFAMYSDYNPTVALVRFLYATSEKPILMKDFMDCFQRMGRQDVISEVETSIELDDSTKANEVLKVGSDLLQKIADLLNRKRAGAGGWRELGSHFNVELSIMDSLEPPRDKEVHSPTTELINWLATARPYTTIIDVAKALEKIKRYDTLKILRSYFDVGISYDISTIEELDIVTDLYDIPEIDMNDEDVKRRFPTLINEALLRIQATEQRKTEDGKRNFGIPSKTIELIGRNEEKEELLDSLTNGKYQMVVMRGTPGCGKTTLVVNVAHDIIEDPHCYSVVYVDSKDVFSLEDLAYKILMTCDITSSTNCPISQVTDLFSHSNQDCVLILENLDHMYHSIDKMNETFTTSQAGSTLSSEKFPWSKSTVPWTKKDEFQCFLNDLAKSAPKLKILVTTWEMVVFVSIKVKHMQLSLLNDEESLELLRSRIDKPLRPEDQEEIDTIIKCCGGIPLLLYAALIFLSDSASLQAACKQFASSPPQKQLELLCPDSLPVEERLNHCLGRCFERMNVCSREVLVLLSVFPNPFTLKEAQHIAKGGKIDEDQLEEGFESLKKVCFLNTYDVESEKYVLHSAIRCFGVSKAKQEKEKDLRTVFEAARWRFISYTLKILSEIEEEFFTTQSKSAIQKYRLQDDNIREIARWCITDSSMDVKVKQFCIQSFIDSQSVLLKLMRSHSLKLILCKFCQLSQDDENLAQLYCECLILGGAKIVIGCLCTPHMCSTALKEALWCFLKAFKALKTESGEASTEEAISDLVSFDVPRVIMESDAISDQAKAQFLINCGKCLVRYGHKDVGFYYIENGIKIRSQCYKASPSNGKHLVMLAVGYNDFAAACTFGRQHKEAISLRRKAVLPIYIKVLGIHPFTATAYSQLARNYLELGDYDKAIMVNEIALRYRQTLLGDHQDTARSLFDKGVILSQQASMCSEPMIKKYEEALGYFEEALEMQQQVLDSREETLKTLQEMVVVLNVLGRTEEEEKRLGQISEYAKKIKENYHRRDV